ncbi:hypothetical protein [Oscillatoria sp. FACHB-1406]|uniref:hypothetical protein n=1 Tax=Oscillatoria sp. FACHB-1406 TaxID=2692846 RepID=UPI001F54E94A|nr:hypothetical protein [Oscillatoria sp. FACHB-1406]
MKGIEPPILSQLMTAPNLQRPSDSEIAPEFIDLWFAPERQSEQVALLMNPARRPVGLTRCRAEYFVRLWIYLFLKQHQAVEPALQRPLPELKLPEGWISCTHREAAAVFYAGKERGSERSAGMILDKLVALGLINKEFDGNTISLQVNPLPQLAASPAVQSALTFQVDDFDARSDAILVANFLARNYNWMNNNTAAVPHRIARRLRQWARQYPRGMRVLRRCDNSNPVGFYVFYPTSVESEQNFFLPPRISLHLSSTEEEDPIAVAPIGDLDCTAIFIRSWSIDSPYMKYPQACQLAEDCQQTVRRMQEDFPNLCDIFGLTIHPILEQLAAAMGFQKTHKDIVVGISWMYQSIDRLIALDVQKALSSVEFLQSK